MDVINAINKRRSIRKFKDIPVEKEKIELLLKAAMQAPSSINEQPWEFIVVENKDTLEKLSHTHPYALAMKNGAVGIIVLVNKDYVLAKGPAEPLWQHDLSAASENILLEAVELGLGATWMAVAPIEERTSYIKDLFKLPENIIPFNMIIVGYPEYEKNHEDRFKPERIHYEKY